METKQVRMKQTNNTNNSLHNGPTHAIDIWVFKLFNLKFDSIKKKKNCVKPSTL
jgi:hypothetical protein